MKKKITEILVRGTNLPRGACERIAQEIGDVFGEQIWKWQKMYNDSRTPEAQAYIAKRKIRESMAELGYDKPAQMSVKEVLDWLEKWEITCICIDPVGKPYSSCPVHGREEEECICNLDPSDICPVKIFNEDCPIHGFSEYIFPEEEE